MDIQPVSLDMHGLMQLGLMTQQLQEQQRHNQAIESHQQAQTSAFTESHEVSNLLNTINATDVPLPVKYQATNRLMAINQKNAGMTGEPMRISPTEYISDAQLFDELAKTAYAKGPTSPEAQQLLQQAMTNPRLPLFQNQIQNIMKQANSLSIIKGWQEAASQATGRQVSPDEATAYAASPQAQAQISNVVAKTPLERQTMEAVQQQADALGVQAGQLDSHRKFLVGYANPSINLTSEAQYISAMFPDGKLGKTASALIGTPIYDELAQKTGALSSQQRSDLASSLKDELKGLAGKQQELQQEWRQSHFDVGEGGARDKGTVEQELNAVQSAIQLKSAELAHVSNPTAETYAQLKNVRQALDQQLEQNKQQSTDLKAQRAELLRDPSGKQVYDKNVALAQQEYTQGAMTQERAGIISKKYGVKVSDVLPAGKDVNKPEVSINLATDEANKEFIKSSRATYDQLKAAPSAIANIERAKALIPSAKGFMGPGGETLLESAKFLNNRLGLSINTEGIKSAEELRSRIFFNILDNLKKMDAQPSQLQQQIMQESLGKLGTDPQALANVLNAFQDTIRDKVERHNDEMLGAEQRGVKFPYDPRIKLPPRKEMPTAPSSGPLSPAEQDELARLRKKHGR